MTLFEYLSVAISLFLALSVTRGLDGFRDAFTPGRIYWVHASWVVIKLFNPVLLWWSFWALQASEWNLPKFAWSLLGPGILYLQVTSLVTRHPESISDWRAHFFGQQREFFVLNLIFVMWSYTTGQILITDLPLVTPLLPGAALVWTCSLVGVVSKSHRVHSVIVILIAATLVLGIGAAIVNPGRAVF